MTNPDNSTATTQAATHYVELFREYFSRELAVKAAKSLSDQAEMEIHVFTPEGTKTSDQPSNAVQPEAVFTFSRQANNNVVTEGKASDPQIIFYIPTPSADQILNSTASDIPSIGIEIGKLLFTTDSSKRIQVKLRSGVFTLLTQGYFGVLTSGGQAFMQFLATMGLNGIGAIKSTLQKLTKGR